MSMNCKKILIISHISFFLNLVYDVKGSQFLSLQIWEQAHL